MQTSDYNCMECNKQFDSASLLLQHFAQHVLNNSKLLSQKTHKKLPKLLPIGLLKLQKSIDDSGNEFDPTRFCVVTFNEDDDDGLECKCDYCGQLFGKTTDLKFTNVCKCCTKRFTRELHKHENNCQKNNR